MRLAGAALALLAVVAPRAGEAQVPDSTPAQRILARRRAHPKPPAPPPPDPWIFAVFAYPTYDGLEGFGGGFTTGWHKASRAGPISSTAQIALTGFISAAGSRTGQVAFDYPGLWPHWRVLAIAGADRLQRAPYFGLGNEPVGDTADAVRYFRYSLLRTTLMGAVERDLAPHLRLHAGVQWRHYRPRVLPGDSTLLIRDIARGAVSDTGPRNIAELRLGLLFDTRDEEFSPSRGVFVEALAGRALSAPGYTRWKLAAHEFIPLGESTVLGLRQGVELADSTLPFYVMYERLTSWRPEDGFGGPTTLRAHLPGRFLAPNNALVSLDLRHKFLDVPLPTSPFRIWGLLFADAGRVWLGGERPDLHDLHWDAGVGGFLQLSKATLFGLNIGYSKTDEFQFGTAFTFAF